MGDSRISQTLIPEYFRLAGYLLFVLMFIVCYTITKTSIEEKIKESPLYSAFRYDNICVYWDYPPARHWGLLISNQACIVLVIYGVLSWVRLH